MVSVLAVSAYKKVRTTLDFHTGREAADPQTDANKTIHKHTRHCASERDL